MNRVLPFLVAVAVCLVSAEWDWEGDENITKTCAEKMKIPGGEDGIEDLPREGPDAEKYRCFCSCVGHGQGILAGDKDEYVPARGKEYLDAIFEAMKEDDDDTPYDEAEIRSDVETCIKNASGEAKCEKACNILECFDDEFDTGSSSEETTEASD